MPMTLGPAANLYAEFSFTAGVAAVMAVVRSRYGQVTESRLPSARSVRRHFIVLRNEGAQRFESARQSPRTKETRLGGDQTPSSPEEAALLRGGLEGRGPRASSELIHCGRPPAHHGCAANDCRTVDELTGGGFAVTIIRGLSGGGSRCGRHQLVVARRRCLRSGTAAREGTVSLLCTPETTSFRTRRTCARRDRARDFDGWRCRNTVQNSTRQR